MSWWMQLLSCFAASICFSLMLNQPKRTILISAVVATGGYGLFMLLNQTTVAYFAATMLIAVLCETFARIMKKVTTLFLTSSLIPLVPGIGLYRTMRYIVEGDYSQALHVGIATIMGICAIALAITFSSVLFSNIPHHKKHAGKPC